MRFLKTPLLLSLFVFAAIASAQQQADIQIGVLGSGQSPTIAVPDIRGLVGTENESTFNTTLWNDLDSSGQLRMVSKSFYPRTAPRRDQDLQPSKDNLPSDPGDRGLWLMGWSEPPVSARYLVFGSLEQSGDRLVLNGWVYDVTQDQLQAAYILGKRYYGSMDEQGAQRVAHDFSRDILQRLGLGIGLAGSRIYFRSDRSGASEIWSMDYDGKNLKQHTDYKNITMTPAVSPDGTRLAFTTYVEGTPKIYIHSLETGRRLTFYNQEASMNAMPDFLSDGKTLAYASSLAGHSQIYLSDLDGRNLRRISYSRSLDLDPAVNPQTGAQVVFTSDRSGVPQIYLMDIDGANVRKLSGGEGDAVQPAWDPKGEQIAFSWTRGFEPGNYNIFVMNVATQRLVQLTHGAGRNENPVFSPSGTHIVFSSDRSGGVQIWTMRADGGQVRRLTTEGRNTSPVWAIR